MRKSTIAIQKAAIWFMALILVLSLGMTPTQARSEAVSSFLVRGQDLAQVSRVVEAYGGTVTSTLDIINSVVAQLPVTDVEKIGREPGIKSVFANAAVNLVSDGPEYREEGGRERVSPATDYPDVVGANLVWAEEDTGKGVTVAVLDTGMALHRGLIWRADSKTPRIVAWKDFIAGKILPQDPNGHGTHIAGIIANSQLGEDQEYNGVAPGVKLVVGRVLNEKGEGTYETVIRGIEWVLANKARHNIKVINLSLVSPAQSAYWADPLNQAVMKAWAAGITVVAAAGNGGSAPMSIGVPGNNPYAITVGSFTDNFTPDNWDDDYITPFSAAGPTLDGFVKPDLVAPGAHMVSTMMPWSYIARNHEADKVANMYFSMAGTSQAAAVVSGASALILAHDPSLTPNQVKFRLMVTAFPWIDPQTTDALYSMWQQGTGRINVPDAVFADDIQGEANFGMDIEADIAGPNHYEGFTEYDRETGTFHLRGDYTAWGGGYGTWSGGYGTWSGGYGTWSGGYGTWSGGYGTWSGGYGTWSGGYGTWSGGYGTWSGGYGTWSGGYGTWSGGYGTWSGGYGTWSGNEPWAGSIYSDPNFAQQFLNGNSVNANSTTTSINHWVDEP